MQSNLSPAFMTSSDNFNNKIPIVFVPALLGTSLHKTEDDDQRKDVFITSSIGLGLDNPDLALPIEWDHYITKDPCAINKENNLPMQFKDDIYPGDPLTAVKLDMYCCRSITIMDQYTTFCNHFGQYKNFYTFGYDWRRDLNETTDRLVEFLQSVKSKHGSSTQVVSHSMGCLIHLAACNTHPSLFHSNCFVGGMFGGGVGFYPMNTDGMVVGINKRYLRPQVVHTFPSMYATASPMGVGSDPILKNKDGRQLWQFVDAKDTNTVIDIDMYNLEEWKKYKIGPWHCEGEVSDKMEQHVKNCLHVGFTFQLRMRNLDFCTHSNSLTPRDEPSDATTTYPPVSVLVGDQFLHPEYFLWDTLQNQVLEWTPKLLKKYDPKHFARTDGTVSHISSSRPPITRDVQIREYKVRKNGPHIAKHRELMNDLDMIENILKDLREVSIM